MKDSLTYTVVSLKGFEFSQEGTDPILKVKGLYATDSQILNMHYHKTYRLTNKSHSYNSGMATHMDRYFRRVEILMKAYNLSDKDSITVLHFLVQLYRACDSNRVSEGIVLCIAQRRMKDRPAFSSKVRRTLYKDDKTAKRRLKAGKNRSLRTWKRSIIYWSHTLPTLI